MALGVKCPRGTFLTSAPTITTGGRVYQLSFPFGTPLALWVYSRTLTLADAQNKALAPAGAEIPLQVASGTKLATITIRVTGRR